MVAVLLGLSAYIFWRVQAGPVDLTLAAPAVRSAANAAVFNGAVRQIGAVTLSKGDDGGYRAAFREVRLGRRGAEATALLPEVVLEVFPSDFISGRAGPRRIVVNGASLRVVRRTDRKLKLDFGEAAGGRARVFQSLTGGAYFREAFERAALTDATLTFVDEASGRTWIGKGAGAEVVRTKEGYAANLASRFNLGGRAAALSFAARYDLSTRVISSTLAVTDAPVGDLIAVFFDADANLLTSPISGRASLRLKDDGAVLASRIDLTASGGVLTLGKFSTPLAHFTAAVGFDAGRNEFRIERAEWRSDSGDGVVSGVVAIDPRENGRGVQRLRFALDSAAMSIVRPTLFDAPLTLGRAKASGVYAVTARALDIKAFEADLPAGRIRGRLAVTPGKNRSPAVAAAARIDGTLGAPALLRIWPKPVGRGARDFVATRVPQGAFSAVDFVMDLKEGAIGADGIPPDDALTLAFRAENASVIYAPGMTPVTGLAGDGVLKGNSFTFKGEKGRIGDIRVTSAGVDIPVIAPKGKPAYFRVSASGDAGDILSVLSEEPLAVLKDTTFLAAQFSGPAVVSGELQRPNLRVAPREAYRYKGTATFSGLAVEDVAFGASLNSGRGRVDLETNGMVIAAEARLGEAPVRIEWKQRFYGGGDKTAITVSGVADSSTADMFGVPTRQIIQGEAPFTARAVGGVDALRALELEADFTNAVLMSEALGWMKPAGARASGSASFAFSKEGTKIAALALSGDGLAIRGAADFLPTGALRSFEAPTFRLAGAADLSLAARREDGGDLVLSATGAYLDAAEMVRTLIENGPSPDRNETPFGVSAKIARVDLRGEASYKDATLEFRRGERGIERLDFRASDAGGKPISIGLSGAEGGRMEIAARSDDVGAMLNGLFALSSVRGGVGRLDFAFTPGEDGAPRAGVLEAHDIRIVKAPLLARIFAAGSLTGLADLVNGEGIALENAIAHFAIEEGAVRVSEARATGPSVGITAEGRVGLGDPRTIDLRGAVAPAYQVNSFLGKAPLIGDLFVNRKGEGLLALSYEVDGAAAEPRVTVNPLSALTPGVLRRMFEGLGAGEKTPPTE